MSKNTNINDDVFLNNWLVGKINDNQLKEKVSSEDFIIYKKIKNSISLLEEFNTPLDNTLLTIKKKRDTIAKTPPQKSKVISLYTKWAISIAAVFLIFFGITKFMPSNTVVINSNLENHKEFALLDDSKVILNKKSTIEYDSKNWDKDNRVLFLKGEAYFEVKKGSTFTVNTNFGNVTVVGTRFSVNVKDSHLDVICFEGKVKVSNDYNSLFLTPGNAVILANKKKTERVTANSSPVWVSGEISFKNTPLKQVIDALELQYNVTFERSSINQSSVYTGSFTNRDIKIALATVFKPMNIKYLINNNIIILTEK